MRGKITLITFFAIFLFVSRFSQGEEVTFTREDRERLIRVEVTLKEFKEAVDRRTIIRKTKMESVEEIESKTSFTN